MQTDIYCMRPPRCKTKTANVPCISGFEPWFRQWCRKTMHNKIGPKCRLFLERVYQSIVESIVENIFRSHGISICEQNQGKKCEAAGHENHRLWCPLCGSNGNWCRFFWHVTDLFRFRHCFCLCSVQAVNYRQRWLRFDQRVCKTNAPMKNPGHRTEPSHGAAELKRPFLCP